MLDLNGETHNTGSQPMGVLFYQRDSKFKPIHMPLTKYSDMQII